MIATTSHAETNTAKSAERPNILFLYTDDQSWQTIGAWNNPDIQTPNIDRLYSQGTTFSHAFNMGAWNGAVCVAARAQLVTGRTVWNCGGKTAGNGQYPLWGQQFRKAGYDTFMTGKWHNGNKTRSISYSHLGKAGGGMYGSTGLNGEAYWRDGSPDEKWSPSDPKWGGQWRKVKDENGKSTPIHSSDLWADEAIQFLKNTAEKSDRPFFMFVAFHAPHDPRQSPQKYVDMYPLDKIKVPANHLPEHPFCIGDHRIRDEVLAPFPRTEQAVKLHLQEYYAIISHCDAAIGRILEQLEKSGKADNTIIVFTGDHGLAVGQHGLIGKQNLYDHSMRVPLIFSGPGIPKGKIIPKQVYYQSLAPTTLEMSGIPIPQTFEFKSLHPMIQGTEGYQGEDRIIGMYRDYQRAIRTERYKLIYYPYAGNKITLKGKEFKVQKPYQARIQLFDLQKDPLEMNNLADNPEWTSIKDTLLSQLKSGMKKLNDQQNLDSPVDIPNYGKVWRTKK
ncbi:sulfatase-like hydrolase/transferase [Verrucomicrobiaceae bacterium N1E253]|uniref:Sulfatase-like hydrolase/transferase n=2 Tax=Oceaniferula marina TaxID=2748318 RepID=A0A851GB99_9BACT|nr:sulfatase-like hydrolase/transferase [Oceaniferula marina]